MNFPLRPHNGSLSSTVNGWLRDALCHGAEGFTLLEMAIVLVIVGLLSGGGMTILSTQMEMRRVRETNALLEEAREALLGFAVAQGRLPRPATSKLAGAENTAACTDDTICTGFIPWATLGISKIDGFGKIIRYSVSPDFAGGANATPPGTQTFNLSTSVATKTVQTRDGAGALTYLAGQALCSSASQCMPAVVFSNGKNNWGTGERGNVIGDNSATNSDEDANNSASTNFISRTPSNNSASSGGEFDDQVLWLSPHILFNRMVASGRLP